MIDSRLEMAILVDQVLWLRGAGHLSMCVSVHQLGSPDDLLKDVLGLVLVAKSHLVVKGSTPDRVQAVSGSTAVLCQIRVLMPRHQQSMLPQTHACLSVP